MPRVHMACLLAGEFLPKWLRMLHDWLKDDADLAEVHAWYVGWTKEIPEEVRSHPLVQEDFGTALKFLAAVSH